MDTIKEKICELVEKSKKSRGNAVLSLFLLIVCVLIVFFAIYEILYVAKNTLWIWLPLLALAFVGWLDQKGNVVQPSDIYPVYIGWNGQRIVPDAVDQAFKDMMKWMMVCYNHDIQNTKNRVVYCFEYVLKADMPMSYDLLMVIQKEAERILARQCQNYNLSLKYEDMVVVDIQDAKLLVSFAKNDEGIKETIQLQANIRRKYLGDQTSHDNGLMEKWDDEHK